MRLTQLAICGFRGYRDRVMIDFAPGFTVVDGRNGTGKSTIFDAIEFALTGTLTKYGKAKAAGETVADYLWWRGEGVPPKERSVELRLQHDGRAFTVTRTPFEAPSASQMTELTAAMVDESRAPAEPLGQLCAASIIRDEQIASLSLDLTETERYARLREAIGATDSDEWIDRAQRLLGAAKRRHEQARSEIAAASTELTTAERRVDEVRTSLASDAALSEAIRKLTEIVGARHAPDQLISITRNWIATHEAGLGEVHSLAEAWWSIAADALTAKKLEQASDAAGAAAREAEQRRADLDPLPSDAPFVTLDVRELLELIARGRQIGPIDGHCPLCNADHDQATFEAGLHRATALVSRLDEAATRYSQALEVIKAAEGEVAEAHAEVQRIEAELASTRRRVADYRAGLTALGFGAADEVHVLYAELERRRAELEEVRHALRIAETLRQNTELERALKVQAEALQRMQRAQERAGRARRAEAAAASIHDAVRRSAGETLDLRLGRVLPLMSELFQRLRPHPFWRDIEYMIRGDVRRFLSLQIGDGLNPQFIFSSGQRRATGLAFLLSINLSIAWGNWQSILLDDPVQHVDDFRTVHLAEVLAQLVSKGRQIVVAVEDPALADLLSRRLPVNQIGSARRITVGARRNGSIDIERNEEIRPLVRRAFPNQITSAAS